MSCCLSLAVMCGSAVDDVLRSDVGCVVSRALRSDVGCVLRSDVGCALRSDVGCVSGGTVDVSDLQDYNSSCIPHQL